MLLNFTTPPPLWRAYARALLARRPALAPAGATVPAIEARIGGIATRRERLEAYRRVCGFAPDGAMPATYPHVLAAPLYLALLTSAAFPVRVLGLVHVRNEIVCRRPIAEDAALDMRCRIAGHRETGRGQEFDLITEAEIAGELVWAETSTFLARRQSPRAPRAARGAGQADASAAPAATRTASWQAPADIGRRYAAVSGDINPIHLTSGTARLFGFKRAIAHGMWSLARTAAELGPRPGGDGLAISASFKAPILLPARITLRSWETGDGTEFALTDAAGQRPHLAGALRYGLPSEKWDADERR